MYDLSAISLMSAPAANALSEPVMRMQPTSASASKASTALRSSSLSVTLSALSACGRLRRTMPTRPRRSTTMVCVLMAVLGFPSAGMLSRRSARGKRVLPPVPPNAARPLLRKYREKYMSDAAGGVRSADRAPTARHVEVAAFPVKNRPETGERSLRLFPTAAGWFFFVLMKDRRPGSPPAKRAESRDHNQRLWAMGPRFRGDDPSRIRWVRLAKMRGSSPNRFRLFPAHDVKQPISFPRRMFAPGFTPNRGVGGAPRNVRVRRHPLDMP